MSHKASLACAGAIAAAATFAGIGPALSHTIVGQRVFPATLEIDDPGVNDELGLPVFTYAPNPDNSNEYDFNGAFQKTIFYNLSFSIADTFTHLNHTALFTNPVTGLTTFGTINGWKNLRTQLKYVPYQNAEHEFIVAAAVSEEWGHTGNTSVGADRFSATTVKGFVGKGFGDVEADWLKPIAVTGEVDYTWSNHPIDFTGLDTFGNPIFSHTPTRLTYGATLQYSLLYMNSFVHEVPEFFRHLIPDFEASFSTPISNIGPSVPDAIPGTHETTGTYGPGLYYLGRLGPIAFELGAVAVIPINRASGRHVGALAILDFFLDDIFPDTIGKPLFGPAQPRAAGLGY
jgi:hypothetical protein